MQLPVADGPFQPTDESLQQYQCPEWFRDAKLGIWSHWGPVAAPGGFGGNWYARQMYVQGTREYEHHVETLRPSVEVRLQGRHRTVEGGEVRPGPPDGSLREGGGEVLRQHGRAPRQLRPVELEAPGVERGQPRPEEGHRRAVAGGGAQARAALRRQRALRAQLQLDAAQPRQRHQRPVRRRAVRRRRSEVRPPVRPAARRHERGLSHQSAGDVDAGVVRPHAGPGRIRTSRTWSIRTAAFPSARSAAASWPTSTTRT